MAGGPPLAPDKEGQPAPAGRRRHRRLARAHRAQAEEKLGQPVRVVCCFEAGYDGFWLHRWLGTRGIENRVLDAASLLVNRRARRAKTDRLDAAGLLRTLMAL